MAKQERTRTLGIVKDRIPTVFSEKFKVPN